MNFSVPLSGLLVFFGMFAPASRGDTVFFPHWYLPGVVPYSPSYALLQQNSRSKEQEATRMRPFKSTSYYAVSTGFFFCPLTAGLNYATDALEKRTIDRQVYTKTNPQIDSQNPLSLSLSLLFLWMSLCFSACRIYTCVLLVIMMQREGLP